jgi:beta-glucosidase
MPVSYPGFKGGDRTDMELPNVQRRCLKALKDAGKKVVFVNCSGSAIAMEPETKTCDAILQAWYPGESGGLAVADVLFGDFNPSGKLPITFYKNSNNMKDFEDYSMKGRTYRFTDDFLFPFGFGLSYTSFEIGNATLASNTIKVGDSLQLSIPVKNTGTRLGTEVVQVYVRKINDVEGPLKTLRAFQRVSLTSGKSQTVNLTLKPTSFEFFDWGQRKMMVTPGEYEVFYGNSSAKNDLKTLKIKIQ